MKFKTLYKPMSRSEEQAVAKYMFRTGVVQVVSALIMDNWAGKHKDDSRGIASASVVTSMTVLIWVGVFAKKALDKKATQD